MGLYGLSPSSPADTMVCSGWLASVGHGEQEVWEIFYLKPSLKEIAWEPDTQVRNITKTALTETWHGLLCGGGVEYLHRTLRVVGGDEKGTQCLGAITGPLCSWGV
jgi:hypothetical protein